MSTDSSTSSLPTASSAAPVESANASCATHITVPGELDPTVQTMVSSSDTDDQLSLDPSLASSCSMAMPECTSTRCNTPTQAADGRRAGDNGVAAAATAGCPPLLRVASTSWCGEGVPAVYKRAAEDKELRAAIAVHAKRVFHELTSFEADDVIDLLYVQETWFSTEVVIHALCLVNRISCRYPRWLTHSLESDSDAGSSYTDSPIRSYSAGAACCLPRVCSSTSSDGSQHDNTEMGFGLSARTLARSCSGSTNSLGEVFTRSNSPRCIMALLLLSSKFHGDIVYNTASLSSAVNKFRDAQRNSAAPLAGAGERRKTMLRMAPGSLGQCEKRLFHELNCSVYVHREEYQCCEALVLQQQLV